MKKFLSVLLALTMMAAMCVSALADDPWDGSFSADGAVSIPAIDVTISATTGAKLFVNPYGFDLKVTDATALGLDELGGASVPDTTNASVFSPTYVLTNNTNIDLDVYVNGKATVKEGSTMTLAKADVTSDSTKKEACIYAHFGTVTLKDDGSVDEFSAGEDASNKFMLATAEAKDAQKVIKLDKSTGTDASAKSSVGFEFDGSAAKNSKEAWTTDDGVTVALTFTFKPYEAPAAQQQGG